MKKKVMLILLAAAMVTIAVPAVQAGTINVVGGDITKGAGWDNGLPTSTSPGFIAVDGVINDDTFGYGSDTVITQTAGTIDGGAKTMNWGAFNGTNGGGTWNMSGGTITVRAFNANCAASGNSIFNISGGALVLNHTGIDLGKGAHISSSKEGSHINISGSAVLDESNATKERNTGGYYDIASDWTGYWTCGVYSGDSWKNFVVDVANFTVDGAPIDAATFDALFVVSDDGKTLSLGDVPKYISPVCGSDLVPGDVVFLWENIELDPNDPDDPNLPNPVTSVYVDVLLGTEPNKLSEGYDMESLVLDPASGQDVTTVTEEILIDGTYFWQVNSYLHGDPATTSYGTNPGDPEMVEGPLCSFNIVSDLAPTSVNIGLDIITWSGEGVDLVADVNDSGASALTYVWSYDAPSDVTVNIDTAAGDDIPTVTVTKDFNVIPIVNPGFEAPHSSVTYEGDYTWTRPVPGWGYLSGQPNDYIGLWWIHSDPNGTDDLGDGYGYSGSAPEGVQIAMGYNDTDYTEDSGFAQVLADTLAADTTYTLSVEVGHNYYYGMETGGYKVQLLAGETVIAQDPGDLTIAADTFETSTITHTSGGVDDPNVGQPLEIRLLVPVPTGFATAVGVDFDNVRLTAVPDRGVSDAVSVVTVTVAVNDEANPAPGTEPVTDSMIIDVYDTACMATRVGLGQAALHTADFDEDCDIDIDDVAEMAIKWLNPTGITVPVVK